ncbi:hypothetical protein ADK52_18105 [Streptomyces sp. WM6372]|nr:hypothetical protein ADK52_18105 [Streptomyces sp. WM6372]
MPSRVSEDPPSLIWLVIRFARTQFQQSDLGLIQVVHLEVEVELLGQALIGPAGSTIRVDPLESDEEAVLTAETGEVGIGLRVRFEAGGLLIERRQSQRIRAIERYRGQLHLQGHGMAPPGPIDGPW